MRVVSGVRSQGVSTLLLEMLHLSTVTSKFTEYLLLTVDCHQQIYRKFASDCQQQISRLLASDSRLSPASSIGKSYDMSRKDLLAARTSFMSFDLRIWYTCTSCLLFIGRKPCGHVLGKSCPIGFSFVPLLF